MRSYLIDLAERVLSTYLEAFLGLLMVGGVTHLDTVKAAAIAGVPAALAVLKGGLAKFTANSQTASLVLPAAPTSPQRAEPGAG